MDVSDTPDTTAQDITDEDADLFHGKRQKTITPKTPNEDLDVARQREKARREREEKERTDREKLRKQEEQRRRERLEEARNKKKKQEQEKARKQQQQQQQQEKRTRIVEPTKEERDKDDDDGKAPDVVLNWMDVWKPHHKEKTRMSRANTQQKIALASDDADKPHKYTVDDAVDVYFGEFLRHKTKTTLGTGKGVKRLRGKSATPRKFDPYLDPELRKIPPWHRKEYVLSERETSMYKHISKVYDNEKLKKKRRNAFYQRVLDLQLEDWKRLHKEFQKRIKQKDLSKYEQQKQLKRLRDQFEEEQVQRFQTQYVTSRILAHEWSTRHAYGLPEDINESHYQAKLKNHYKPPKTEFRYTRYNQINVHRYDPIFRIHGPVYAHGKAPKMGRKRHYFLGDNRG